MTLDKNPRDTAVGTVGDYLNIEREGEQFAIMNFQITTFGDPVAIEVEYTWDPEQTENPEIKTGMVVRIRGWLDDEGRLDADGVVGGRRGPRSERAGMRGPELQRMDCDAASPGPDQPRHHHPRRRRGSRLGADSMAGRYAQENNIPCRDFPAEWRRYGRSAGYRRNQQMLDEGKPDLVVAFPGGPGTQNMVKNQPAAGLRGQHHRPPGRIPSTGTMPP